MTAARQDPIRALIFYQPGNDSTTPGHNSLAWDLRDGGAWKTHHHFPVYAIPGAMGSELMHQLSLYSGNMTSVPYGHQISELPDIDPRDYVRLYTEIGLSTRTVLPTLWVYFLIVIAVLVVCLGGISALMHYVQRAKRRSLRRRVANGEVDLEALGIQRLRVPPSEIERLPLFTYVSEEETPPTSPRKSKHFTSIKEDDFQEESSRTMSPVSDFRQDFILSVSDELPTSELVPVDHKPHPPAVLVHKFLPYSQPTCPICLEDFESGVSEIRELPCGHIYHSECIDTFLSQNSSLCPMCKKSALPIGCCPTKITNAMVRREFNLRRIRSRVTVPDENDDIEAYGTRRRLRDLKANLRRGLLSSQAATQEVQPLPLQPQPVFVASPAVQPSGNILSSELSRQDLVEQRIRELEAGQVPIRDPDVMTVQRPQCEFPLYAVLDNG